MSGESAQSVSGDRREGACASSGGIIFQIRTIFGRIRRILRIRIGFLANCWCLLPEGDSQLPTVKTDSLYVLPLPLRLFRAVAARQGCRALRKERTFLRLFGHAQKAEAFGAL